MPNLEQYRPNQAWIPADTWVELTFIDETGADLPVIRRSQNRSPQGKLKETPPDLSMLGIDPISLRIGTVMPGLLPLIKVGSESELGRAVAELTGLSTLVDLADHARRSKTKIEKEFVKAKLAELDQTDSEYLSKRGSLESILATHTNLRPEIAVPLPSADEAIETGLHEIATHFEVKKSEAFASARSILGEDFDPTDLKLISDLERNIGRALERASQIQGLPSAARLGALRQLTIEELDKATSLIRQLLDEGAQLDALAKDGSKAARVRLYSLIATWVSNHPDAETSDDVCVVCSSNINAARDPITGELVREHLHAAAVDAELLSQTLRVWAERAHGNLLRILPDTLRSEAIADLPDHPSQLLRTALIDELFAFDPFKGALSALRQQTESAFDSSAKDCAELDQPTAIHLPAGCELLNKTLRRLDAAIRFCRWRKDNESFFLNIVNDVLGRIPKEGQSYQNKTLVGKLLDLESTVKASKPISDALAICEQLAKHIQMRRATELRLKQYAAAADALVEIITLGGLADQQVDQLRKTLRKEAADWRSRIYLGAFPDTAHELVDASMGRKGELDLVVRTGGVSAPAQHVTNASALRASLVAFFLAFWEYVLKERGGLTILLLDDPQELLDDENKERLACSLATLSENAQLIITSHDSRFLGRASRLRISAGIEHLEVLPATRQQPLVRTTPPLPAILQRKSIFEEDPNIEESAQNFADGCRVFFEAKLGDMFDDPAHSAWAIANPHPTLATFVQRLRPLSKTNPQGIFASSVFRRFVDHPALIDESAVLVLMNKSHHGRRVEIRASDVAHCANQLNELLELVEQMHEECCRWRRRDRAVDDSHAIALPPALSPTKYPALNIEICPDLAAFTQGSTPGESQEPIEPFDVKVLEGTVNYYLRRPNFGFAAPEGSIAIVDTEQSPVGDRRLVIARYGATIYARRLVRGADATVIGLTAEIPDPTNRPPKTLIVPEVEVATHQVVGIIFEHSIAVARGQDEAVQVDAGDALRKVSLAFRVTDDSAVPLALNKQVVLGGPLISLDELSHHKDKLVALALDDGSSIFKRVGSSLPGDLSRLVQFESIGGLGASQILSVGEVRKGFRQVISARSIVGVLYRA